MAVVMIGVDPHKASHTAVAVSADEEPLGQLRVRASAVQARRLVEWAAPWPERSWAVEGAGGLGHLLAQQLVAAGERVLDVQPKLAARVRLLADEAVNKNDPNDARSVAVTALRSRTVREVAPDDHCAVLKMWSRRQHDLGRNRTRVACRLHAALCELVPGGIGKEITAASAARVLDQVTPSGAAQQARRELAADLLADLRRADEQLHETRKKLAAAVEAAGTTLTEVFGVGPVIAATVIGEAGDISRFASRDAFAAYDGTALGLVPLGTTNNFARTLGIPLTLAGAIGILAGGKVADVDLGRAGDTVFANLVSAGLSAQVAASVPHRLKRVAGRAAYPADRAGGPAAAPRLSRHGHGREPDPRDGNAPAQHRQRRLSRRAADHRRRRR